MSYSGHHICFSICFLNSNHINSTTCFNKDKLVSSVVTYDPQISVACKWKLYFPLKCMFILGQNVFIQQPWLRTKPLYEVGTNLHLFLNIQFGSNNVIFYSSSKAGHKTRLKRRNAFLPQETTANNHHFNLFPILMFLLIWTWIHLIFKHHFLWNACHLC